MPKVSTKRNSKTTNKTKTTEKKRILPNSRVRFCHRLESRYYESTSGFHSVWLSLCEGFNSGKRTFMRESHIYFLSKILQDSLLTHRLNQGLAAMIGLSRKCAKIPELFCMAGLEILKKIPCTHMLCLQFYKNMFLACHDNKQEILLNFALYLVLRQQDVKEGLELLKSKSSLSPFSANVLHKAYIGLFEYLLWQLQQTKNGGNIIEHCEEDEVSDEEQLGEFGETSASKRVGFSAKNAMNLFEEVFSVPGVWDVFVPAYIDLLKHYKKPIQTRRFLENYRDRNMLNPNTHRYLYHFLKSNSGSDEDLMEVLEGLIKLDPTSECLGELIDLKVKSGTGLKVSMRIIFEKLDHSGCMFDDKTWKILESHLLPKDGGDVDRELKEQIDFCWKERKSWWPEYHFRTPHDLDSRSDKWSVLLTKANIAEYFLGKENDFSKEVRSKHRKV